ncbi:hypothetical protein ACES2L_06095 [Bdellovibrio bacteriovorus]
MRFIFIFFILLCGIGCEALARSQAPIKETVSTPPVEKPIEAAPILVSWEKGHPERKVWTTFVSDLLKAQLLDTYDTAKDVKRICPSYETLSKEQRVLVWTEFISALAYHESTWDPTSRMVEKNLQGKKNPVDPITKKAVYSEGLLQLSYQDIQWAPYCQFNWAKDKNLSGKDPSKTILNPIINLDCGMRILANQIKNKGKVILSSGVYWAVIKDGGRYQQIEKIISKVRQTGLCG